jgi:transposase
MRQEVRRRLPGIQRYEETLDVGLECRRCGISSPTLCTRLQRYAQQGEAGLVSQRRRPKPRPRRTVFKQEEAWSLELRRERNFDARRIQQELQRPHGCRLGPEAIHIVRKTA